jgi:ribonuclease PH
MRIDGRQPDELRPVVVTPNFVAYPEGSLLIALGDTRVLCNVTIEDGVPRWMQRQNRPGGWVTGEYAMLPRSTLQRTARETNGLSGRTQEIRRLIGRSLRAAVDLEKLGLGPVRWTVMSSRRMGVPDSHHWRLSGPGNRLEPAHSPGFDSTDTLSAGVATVSVGVIGSDALLTCAMPRI